jgi:hypothetical protein
MSLREEVLRAVRRRDSSGAFSTRATVLRARRAVTREGAFQRW